MRHSLLLAATALASSAHAFDFDKTPGRLPKNVAPSAYTLDLTLDPAKLTSRGHETVALAVRSPTDTFVLSQNALSITRARLEDGSAAKITANNDLQTVTLVFPHNVAAGQHTLTVDWTGPIPETPAGLYYADYKRSGAKHRMLITQFESIDARRMFPCWDEPAFKATFKVSVTLPKDMVALSNTPVAERDERGGTARCLRADAAHVHLSPRPCGGRPQRHPGRDGGDAYRRLDPEG